MLDATGGLASRVGPDREFAELIPSIIPMSISPQADGGDVIRLHAEDTAAGQPLRILVTFGGGPHEFWFDVMRGG